MSILKRGTAALPTCEEDLAGKLPAHSYFPKGPPLAPETREDSPNTVNPGLADTGGRLCQLMWVNPEKVPDLFYSLTNLMENGKALYLSTHTIQIHDLLITHTVMLYWIKPVVPNLGAGTP